METYYGIVRSVQDATKLFEACRLGLLPRVQRRLSEKERQSIRSGSVFVWDEREAGMRRWTDGKSWSASRVSGSFLTYREMEGKRGGGFGSNRRGSNKSPESGRGSDEDHENDEPEGYKYKTDGLMKQSFSITTSAGQHLHLISYYSRQIHGQPELLQPMTDPSLRHIVPTKGLYPESTMSDTNQTPVLTRAPMQQPYMPQTYMHPPQPPHGQPYHAQYAHPHPGYWTNSPAQPPYNNYTTAPYPPYSMSSQHMSHAPPPTHHYGREYEPRASEPRASISLPPPQSTNYPPDHYRPSRFTSPGPPLNPPREHQFPTTAQASMGDSRAGGSASRNPQGPLPALNAVAGGPPGTSYSTEVNGRRGRSTTPPRSSHSDGQPRNLSSLLHPTSSEYNNSSNSSGGTSPRTSGVVPVMLEGVSEDTRALRRLDRTAFIRHATPAH